MAQQKDQNGKNKSQDFTYNYFGDGSTSEVNSSAVSDSSDYDIKKADNNEIKKIGREGNVINYLSTMLTGEYGNDSSSPETSGTDHTSNYWSSNNFQDWPSSDNDNRANSSTSKSLFKIF